MGNRERIIEAAWELFNDLGTHNVSTNHIAAHLSISPGNLYYHFRNREEIVRALFQPVADTVHTALAYPTEREIRASDLANSYLRAMEGVWNYRFFFRDIDELLSRDPDLAVSFDELRDWTINHYSGLFERLIGQKQMRRPEPPEDLKRIATNCFILWTSWIRFLSSSAEKIELTPAHIAEGALHSFLTFAPYVEDAFVEQVRAVFDSNTADAARSGKFPGTKKLRAKSGAKR